MGLQTASLFGSYIITFALVTVNMCVAYVIAYRKGLKTMGIATAAVLLFQYGVGTAVYLTPADSEETVSIAAVQGNIDSKEKWSVGSITRTIDVYEKYTLEAAGKGADLGLREAPRVVQILVGEGERVCACARARVYERGAGAGRRGWPRSGGARRAAC